MISVPKNVRHQIMPLGQDEIAYHARNQFHCRSLQQASEAKIQIYMIQCRHTSNLNIINLLRVLSGNSRKISTLGLPQGLAEKGEGPF